MERDALIAHGGSKFLKERMMETSDAYSVWICGKCGLFAQRVKGKNPKAYTTKYDVYHCPACRNDTDVGKVNMPYAFKLLMQEMMAMNIAPRIRFEKNKFHV